MSTVRINIAGHDYEVACDDGQEAHLKSLARSLDMRARELTKNFNKIGESDLLMLSAIMLTDELQDRTQEVAQLRHDIQHSSQSFEQNKQIELESAVADTINDIASRIEAIAAELERV
jgi:cell division protein ZapA